MKLRAGTITRCVAISSLALQLAGAAPAAAARTLPPVQGTAGGVQKSADLRLKVMDAATGRPVRNTAVEIYSDNGVRCVRAPCPTNGVRWTGRTDARGVVTVPGRVRQRSMTISAAGYGGKNLTRESKRERAGAWVIALDPDVRPASRDE